MVQFINQGADNLNRIAFELLDYNSDGEISEVDLFVGLTLQDQVIFKHNSRLSAVTS